jgi:hypothetical protein
MNGEYYAGLERVAEILIAAAPSFGYETSLALG